MDKKFRQLKFCGDSKSIIQALAKPHRTAIGQELLELQFGNLDKLKIKPFKELPKSGIDKLTISRSGGSFRVIFTAKFGDTIYVLHTYQKKTRKTTKKDIEIVRQRHADLKALLEKNPKGGE